MMRVFHGRRFYWLMSYVDRGEAEERAERHRCSCPNALARITRSRRGFYEVWGSHNMIEEYA